MTRLLPFACALIAALPSLAEAQTRRPPRPPSVRRVELGAGAGIAGGVALGERDATLRSNSVSASPFRLFATDTRLSNVALLEVRLGYRVTPRLTAEGLFTFARPDLTSSLSADVENAAAVEATTRLTEYIVTGGALWRFSADTRRRWTPFVGGGAGVARHVHDGGTLAENGVDVYGGGGVIYRLGSSRAATSRTGLRLDGRLHVFSGGVAEGHGASPRGVLSGSMFVTF